MSDVSGIPNLGIPGLSGFNGGGGVNGIPGSSGLASAQDQYLQNLRFFGNQAATQAAAEVPQSQLYGGGSFGAQPAYYAGVGAAYGRATGGFGGGGNPAEVDPSLPGGSPTQPEGGSPARVDVASSPFDTENAGAVPYLSGGGMPFGGGGFSGYSGSPFSRGASPIDISGGGAPFGGGGFNPGAQPATSGPMDFNSLWSSRGVPGLITNNYFNDITAQPAKPPTFGSGPGGGTSFIEPDIASNPGSLRMPNSQALLGYDPAQSAQFAPGSGGGFQGRFGFGFPNAGTPSQYTTGPYEDAQGQTRQPNIPPGYQTLFSADNPGGALPAGGFRGGGSPPIMNQGGDENPFEAGASHIGPTMGPFMGATPGGGVGRGTAPSSFAPSSPFEGGTSPVPYPYAGGQAFPGAGIGSAQGSMRDRIAAIMSGSQGNTPPLTSGPSLVNGGPGGTGGPVPTQPQMNDAWSRIRVGPGSPGVSSIAQQVPPPQSSYAPINQAIYDIGNASRPGMFDSPSQPLGSMFSPGQYRGR